jgi:Meckel syndrome type 1 protein
MVASALLEVMAGGDPPARARAREVVRRLVRGAGGCLSPPRLASALLGTPPGGLNALAPTPEAKERWFGEVMLSFCHALLVGAAAAADSGNGVGSAPAPSATAPPPHPPLPAYLADVSTALADAAAWAGSAVAASLPGLPPTRFRALLDRLLFLNPDPRAYCTPGEAAAAAVGAPADAVEGRALAALAGGAPLGEDTLTHVLLLGLSAAPCAQADALAIAEALLVRHLAAGAARAGNARDFPVPAVGARAGALADSGGLPAQPPRLANAQLVDAVFTLAAFDPLAPPLPAAEGAPLPPPLAEEGAWWAAARVAALVAAAGSGDLISAAAAADPSLRALLTAMALECGDLASVGGGPDQSPPGAQQAAADVEAVKVVAAAWAARGSAWAPPPGLRLVRRTGAGGARVPPPGDVDFLVAIARASGAGAALRAAEAAAFLSAAAAAEPSPASAWRWAGPLLAAPDAPTTASRLPPPWRPDLLELAVVDEGAPDSSSTAAVVAALAAPLREGLASEDEESETAAGAALARFIARLGESRPGARAGARACLGAMLGTSGSDWAGALAALPPAVAATAAAAAPAAVAAAAADARGGWVAAPLLALIARVAGPGAAGEAAAAAWVARPLSLASQLAAGGPPAPGAVAVLEALCAWWVGGGARVAGPALAALAAAAAHAPLDATRGFAPSVLAARQLALSSQTTWPPGVAAAAARCADPALAAAGVGALASPAARVVALVGFGVGSGAGATALLAALNADPTLHVVAAVEAGLVARAAKMAAALGGGGGVFAAAAAQAAAAAAAPMEVETAAAAPQPPLAPLPPAPTATPAAALAAAWAAAAAGGGDGLSPLAPAAAGGAAAAAPTSTTPADRAALVAAVAAGLPSASAATLTVLLPPTLHLVGRGAGLEAALVAEAARAVAGAPGSDPARSAALGAWAAREAATPFHKSLTDALLTAPPGDLTRAVGAAAGAALGVSAAGAAEEAMSVLAGLTGGSAAGSARSAAAVEAILLLDPALEAPGVLAGLRRILQAALDGGEQVSPALAGAAALASRVGTGGAGPAARAALVTTVALALVVPWGNFSASPSPAASLAAVVALGAVEAAVRPPAAGALWRGAPPAAGGRTLGPGWPAPAFVVSPASAAALASLALVAAAAAAAAGQEGKSTSAPAPPPGLVALAVVSTQTPANARAAVGVLAAHLPTSPSAADLLARLYLLLPDAVVAALPGGRRKEEEGGDGAAQPSRLLPLLHAAALAASATQGSVLARHMHRVLQAAAVPAPRSVTPLLTAAVGAAAAHPPAAAPHLGALGAALAGVAAGLATAGTPEERGAALGALERGVLVVDELGPLLVGPAGSAENEAATAAATGAASVLAAALAGLAALRPPVRTEAAATCLAKALASTLGWVGRAPAALRAGLGAGGSGWGGRAFPGAPALGPALLASALGSHGGPPPPPLLTPADVKAARDARDAAAVLDECLEAAAGPAEDDPAGPARAAALAALTALAPSTPAALADRAVLVALQRTLASAQDEPTASDALSCLAAAAGLPASAGGAAARAALGAGAAACVRRRRGGAATAAARLVGAAAPVWLPLRPGPAARADAAALLAAGAGVVVGEAFGMV